jgi:hypothetical protein
LIAILLLSQIETSSTTIEEEITDFEEEEKRSKADDQAALGGSTSDSIFGVKLFVDMLVDYRLGDKSFQFRPNHTYVFVQVSVFEDLQFMIHVSDNPIFWELSYNALPNLRFSGGKLLIPFGTNNFHHIIGGRVDEFSRYLPETWGDYGLSVTHLVVDEELFNLEYVLYAVNGFSGVDAPNIADGSPSDNNLFKAIGTRITSTFFRRVILTLSGYYDRWDADNEHSAFFYAVGLELTPGLIPVPFLKDIRVRGEWARGEIQLPDRNHQRGFTEYAFARTGYYFEIQFGILQNLAFRVRTGRINPDNTVTDDGDIEVYEPALLVGLGSKLWWTFAYQFTARPGFDYHPKDPPDVVYAKFFLQY